MTEDTKSQPIEPPASDCNNTAAPGDLKKTAASSQLKTLPFDANKAVSDIVEALSKHFTNTGEYTAMLLGLVVVCFSLLAAFAIYNDYVDTAEKILIGLISFLSGAAIFSSTPKK